MQTLSHSTCYISAYYKPKGTFLDSLEAGPTNKKKQTTSSCWGNGMLQREPIVQGGAAEMHGGLE